MHIPDYITHVLSVLVLVIVSVSLARGCSAMVETGRTLAVERAILERPLPE